MNRNTELDNLVLLLGLTVSGKKMRIHSMYKPAGPWTSAAGKYLKHVLIINH